MISARSFFLHAAPFIAVFTIHYVATNIYASLCAGLSIIGFLRSMMATGSPVCGVLLSIIQYTYSTYGVLIAGLGTAFVHSMGHVWNKSHEP